MDTPAAPARIQYGRSIRHLWELADDAVFLNHGSFGACPKAVLAEQDRIRREMEREPDAFFRNGIMPAEGVETALRSAASELAAFVGVRGEQLAFVENATVGIQAVLRSIAFDPGDQILITDHTYNAVRLMVERRCAVTGAKPLVARIPVPTHPDAMGDCILSAIEPSVKLAILDHITSPTALLMPLERLIPMLHARGILVLVDGAHAVGQVPLDLAALQPDWYVSNCHKWLFAPKGSAFLYASDAVAPATCPNVVSHFIAMGFPRAFDFTGTRDNSAWLAVPAAMKFHKELDPVEASRYHSRLLQVATEELTAVGARPVGPMRQCAAMRSFVLPQSRPAVAADAPELMSQYWNKHRMQLAGHVFNDTLLLRVSAQAYVDLDDIRRMRDALDRHGWPGRN